jgi:hypothetical protein
MDLKRAYKRSGAFVHVYKMWNKCMQQWLTVLSRTYMTLHTDPGYFASDLLEGPFVGNNLQCENGMIPRFVGWDSKTTIKPSDALIEKNGHVYVSGMVNPALSGCVPAFKVK